MSAAASIRVSSFRRPWWLGALLAPLVAPFALMLMVAVSDTLSGRTPQSASLIEVGVLAFVFGLPLAYTGMCVFGLPLTWALDRAGRLSAPLLCLAALPLGAAVLMTGLVAFGANLATPVQAGMGALLGLSVALAFCLLCGIGWRPR